VSRWPLLGCLALALVATGCGKTRQSARPQAPTAGEPGTAGGAESVGEPSGGGAGVGGARADDSAGTGGDTEPQGGSTCTCAPCEDCTGPGGTCVALGLREQDSTPPGACDGDNWCTEDGRCEQKAQVVVGTRHTCALLPDGNVRCWGSGTLGYVNTKTIGDDETPASAGNVDVGGRVIELAAGETQTCALLEAGNVRCWGAHGETGVLGYGDWYNIGDDETPGSVGDVNIGGKVRHIVASTLHVCALLEGGSVRCWGQDAGRGFLGYPGNDDVGDNESPYIPGDVALGAAVRSVAVGPLLTCAVLMNGQERCWGENKTGQLGLGHHETIGDDEQPVSAGSMLLSIPVLQAAPGAQHNCSLLAGGKLRCWGSIYPFNYDTHPDAIPNIDVGMEVQAIASGEHHVCALSPTGDLKCWGKNTHGELGSASIGDIATNDVFDVASAPKVAVGGAVFEMALGVTHTCVLLADARIRCWGDGSAGQLGYGNTQNVGDYQTPASVGDVPYR
jgi:alpha-tubulin suppressor-like RCC1 family protein